MVDGDDRESGAITLHRHLDCRLVKGCINVVDGNGIVWVGCVAADIAYDAEFALRRLEAFFVDERWNWIREVDAIDENVRLDNLRIWSMMVLGLSQIPLVDLRAANLFQKIYGT